MGTVERFQVANVDDRETVRLLQLLTQFQIGGKQVHDANIVATMLGHGIDQVLTHNVNDFVRFSPWITVLPLE
jgi:hypothetical protein